MSDPRARTTLTIAERRRILRIAGVAGPILVFFAAFAILHDGSTGLNRWLAAIAVVFGITGGALSWYLSYHLAETHRDR